MASKSSKVQTVRLPNQAVQQVKDVAAQTGQPPATVLKLAVLDWLQNYAARTLTEQEAGLSFSQN